MRVFILGATLKLTRQDPRLLNLNQSCFEVFGSVNL